jgi:hypothetical protein
MSKTLKRSKKSQKLLEILAEMMDSSIDALNEEEIQMNSLSLKQTYLILVFGVVNSYSEAVFELCKQYRPRPAILLLRSILEAWINIAYFLSHNSDNRLLALMMHDSFSKLGLVEEMDKFASKYPHIVEGSAISKQSITVLKESVAQELKSYKKVGLEFSSKSKLEEVDFFETSLLERARRADARYKGSDPSRTQHPFEYQYLVVYRYFSDFTHINLKGTDAFVNRTQAGYDLLASQTNDGVEMELVTLFVIYLSFLNKLKDYKIVSVPKLNSFNRFFNEVLVSE